MKLSRARAGLVLFSTVIALTAPLTSYAQATSDSTSSPQATIDPHNIADVETAVRGYFADIPVMAEIAKCESSFTQYNSSGGVLNGGSGGMMGVFQINKSVHASFAKSLGDDIATLAGNMAYARYLYTNEGTDPWYSSKGCWGPIVSSGLLPAAASSTLSTLALIKDAVTPTLAQAQTKPATAALTQNLKAGSSGAQVATLQQLLNSAGYKIAKTGAGSPGQETTTFGPSTKLAVQRFQCAHNIACKGSEGTTGYGLVGAKTRAALVLNS